MSLRGRSLLLLALLGGVHCIGAFVLPTIPQFRTAQRRYRVLARLSGGQDPHFSFGGKNPEKGKAQAPTGALPENPTTTQALALRVQSFMTGSQKLAPSVGGMPYMSGNNYVDLFVTLSPDEMIAKFKATAPPRVQDAMQRTVLRCIGSMRDFLVEDSHKTTGVLFANLLYKAQVTGYMLFNAEQQVALTLSPFAAELAKPQPQHLLPTGEGLDEQGQAQDEAVGMAMTGLVRVTQPDGTEVEVEPKEYVEALREEARTLKEELIRLELEKRELVARDLLAYISQLSSRQSAGLTSGMTQNVVEAMKMLVSRVLNSIRAKPNGDSESLELDSKALAQLIMWGLVTGYSLRELENAWGNYGKPAEPSLLQTPSPKAPPRRRSTPPPPPPPRGGRRPRGGGPPRGDGPTGGSRDGQGGGGGGKGGPAGPWGTGR